MKGTRKIPFADLHRLPGDRPDLETILEHGEIITAIEVPVIGVMKGSHYLKARDRQAVAGEGRRRRAQRQGIFRIAGARGRTRGVPGCQAALEDSAYKLSVGADVVAGALMTAHERARKG